jgi:enamine deaminase RidA (YjgF/YER057c/UK114 family)
MTAFNVNHINPDGLIKNPAFTNVITVSGKARTIYIGEQNANNAEGQVVGKGDLRAQTAQVLSNIKTALAAAGAQPENVIKWSIYLLQGQDLQEGFEAFRQSWGQQSDPPVITMIYVTGLSNPDYLIGMDAIAVTDN